MSDFIHLHCHSQYSLLDGATNISEMMEKASQDQQLGVALTDHGNMFGVFKFAAEAKKNNIKPIIGCEFYLVEDRHKRAFSKISGEKDRRYHQLLLAKDQRGYENLSKLCSLGFIEGLYGKFPRIDKELLVQYHEGLIATSCCLGAEIPQAILHGDYELAESRLKWWIDLLGEDFYIELQRHRGLENIDRTGVSQEDINQKLIEYSKKYNLKVIATNDSHYLDEDDWKSHDILLCVNTNSKVEEIDRFKFPSSDFFFKTKEEMAHLFKDVPEALDNTMDIFHKIEAPELKRDILLPNFPLPSGYTNQPEYLRYLVYEGAKMRYGEISEIVRERLDHELSIIKNMGFDGYFLIVQDFIRAARDLGVSVGPGRGSAAGSAVAYCLTITNLDPIHYNLLFERFLNPERISMPDIDIDFDDEGRQKVIDWVVNKYGRNQVAQIITYGTMAARSSIRDVGRVMDIPLSETDFLAKLIPGRPNVKLTELIDLSDKEIRDQYSANEYTNVSKLRDAGSKENLKGEAINLAKKVEGSVRNTGIHAAGIIIAPDDIKKFIPVCTSKETDLLITQFEGSLVEDAGMLKMDFLGLKTLSILKDCVENIAFRFGEEKRIDLDLIPLDDEETFKLFQKGNTIGIFQFESEGMQNHLKNLKPTNIEDLIAMNALYRPGPMDYIETFIARKHGKEKIEYPHEWLEDMLKPTYGIMVYQEQIMQSAQIMANYSLGKADVLRRAMGKKKLKEMQKQREIFVEGATNKGVEEEKAQEIFDIMSKFASYGFNRSHAAAYSILAYQTAYLKTHYTAEFMASVLTHNKNDIGKLNLFLRETKKQGIEVLGPDVNESQMNFTVNESGKIRFGLSALKGIGEGPVEALLEEKSKGGNYQSIFDMTRRLNLRSVNKKCLESLVLGGAMDSYGTLNRAQYFSPVQGQETLIEFALKYGQIFQRQKVENQSSLFGESLESGLDEPAVPQIEEWPLLEKLNREKEVAGIYISGHPLDQYRLIVENYTSCNLADSENFIGKKLSLAGLVTGAQHRISKKGTGWGIFTLQDYIGSLEFVLFTEDYQDHKGRLEVGQAVFLNGTFQMSRDGRKQFKLHQVRQLASIGESLTKGITLHLGIDDISQEMVDNLAILCKNHKGNHTMKLVVVDPDEQFSLPMISHSQKVLVNSEFVEELEKQGIRYKLDG